MSAESFFAEREYQLGHSLRFDHVAAHKLSRTPAAAGNRKTWTWSAWVKRGFISTQHDPRQVMMGVNVAANDTQSLEIGWHSDDKFYITTQNAVVQTTQLFRDPSAWYHIVVVANTTLAGATDRFKLYVNGVDQSLGNLSSVSQNDDTAFNQAGLHTIGDGAADRDLDGYLSEVHFLDGYAYGPEYFGTTGEFDEEWLPIQYTGAYGTNGFYLTFAGGGVMSATGGNSTATDGDFKAASFTANGTFTPSADGYVEYLVIGGGGGGARGEGGSGGGGGAGGYRTGMLDVTSGTGYSITVGAGGNAITNGSSSVFSSITSTGGGAGSVGQNGVAGGSGGGAAGQASKVGGSSSAFGNDGGDGVGSGNYGAGGGGGAGAVGVDGTTTVGGNGGAGIASSITGSSVTRAGGGGGGSYNGGTSGTGGSGGGGNAGAAGTANNAVAGTTNTGSGGGGGSYQAPNWGAGGAGGSGIVIIRYKYQ